MDIKPDNQIAPEKLLVEVEDVLRTMPLRATLRHERNENFQWLGRAAAVIDQWDDTKSRMLSLALKKFNDRMAPIAAEGFRELMILLNQAQNELRMKTLGPMNIAIEQGRVFEYFDEVRKLLELAVSEVFFVDPYLDADFVARYLRQVKTGVQTKLLMGTEPFKLAKLLPAVDLFSQETQQPVAVRTTVSLHDRYLFVDRASCYFSDASFKDGGRKSGTVISQIVDAFESMLLRYDNLWSSAKVER